MHRANPNQAKWRAPTASIALTTLRALKTALTNAAIESGNKDNVVEDPAAMAIVRKQIKQRQDSITQFEEAGRPELAENEKAEVAVLEKYLPAGLSADEVSQIVKDAVAETGATSRADMGKVMGWLKPHIQGRADMGAVSASIKQKLSA